MLLGRGKQGRMFGRRGKVLLGGGEAGKRFCIGCLSVFDSGSSCGDCLYTPSNRRDYFSVKSLWVSLLKAA